MSVVMMHFDELVTLALKDDWLFISSCIDHALIGEMVWHNVVERIHFITLNPHILGCTCIAHGTFLKIQKPWNNLKYSKWFNEHVMYE